MTDVSGAGAARSNGIGRPMNRADYEAAREALANAGQPNASVTLARAGGLYTGKVVLVTDTHLVQSSGPRSAVAHDLALLANRTDVERKFDAGHIQQGKTRFIVQYVGESGRATPAPRLTEREANRVAALAEQWAEGAISSVRARTAFVKNIDRLVFDVQSPAIGRDKQVSDASLRPLDRETEGQSMPVREALAREIRSNR